MNNTIRKTDGDGPAKRLVRSEFTRPGATTTFEFNHPTATTISVAGTFNDWRPGAAPMIPLGVGRWIKALTLPPGKYEYRRGGWQADVRSTGCGNGAQFIRRVELGAPRAGREWCR